MNTEKHLILLEVNEGESIEEIFHKNQLKLLEDERISNGELIKVGDFYRNELRQEYLLEYKWYQESDQKKDPMLLEINEETYNRNK